MNCKKGQYFSFDAIVGAVIFVMAISILLNHWFTLNSQMNEQTTFLQDEALRLSEIMMSAGDYDVADNNPNKKTAWYELPTLATRAGFGVNGSFEGHLVHGGAGQPSISHADNYIPVNPTPGSLDYAKYDDSRMLMALPIQYYIEFNLTITNPKDFTYGSKPLNYINEAIGIKPSLDAEVVKVIRPVYVVDSHPVFSNEYKNAYYTGHMTVYVWMGGSRS